MNEGITLQTGDSVEQTSYSCQMTWRYLRRRKGQIFFVLVLLSVLLLWSNVSYMETLMEQGFSCKYPCVGAMCLSCAQYTTRAVPIVNILSHLKLKRSVRQQMGLGNKSSSESVCRHLNFDLKHDSVKQYFFKMPELNCSKEELFYLEAGVFKMNRSVLNGRPLKKCEYMGIERVTDDFSTYTETVTREEEPFDMVIQEDFVRIKCQLVKPDEDNDDNDKDLKIDDSGEALAKHDKDTNYENKDSNDFAGKHDNNINTENKDILVQDTIRKSMVRNKSAEHNPKKVLPETGNDSINHPRIPQRKLLDESNDDNLQEDDENVGNGADESNEMEGWLHYDDFYGNYEYEKYDFDQLLVQIHPKPSVHARINNLMKQGLPDQRMNVLILGFDSMSHLAFQRKLSKTYRYLKETLGAVALNSYNIVGDATTAALLPILTGMSEEELPEARKNRYESEYVDRYPLIWKDFQRNGYVTMFAEDEPTIGVFNLRLSGFDKQPTDHYMRPFWQALWDTELRSSSPRFCTGNHPNHMYLLNYTRDFFVKYSNVSKFAFVFGSELTHWDNNPGEYMDQDVVNLLTFLKVKGHLDNTLLVMMADHGARYNRVRRTVQGKIEERLPMMALLFPPWFKKKYPDLYQNLQNNADHLATPFDIHETLQDIVDPKRTEVRNRPVREKMSLLQAVPGNRTCAAAGIQMHWCTCLKQLDLDPSDGHVRKAAEAVLSVINSKTKPFRKLCAELRIRSIQNAFLLVPNEKVLMFQRSMDEDNRVANFSADINVDHAHFQITIETYPNKGIFEGTVQVNMTAGSYMLMADASRLDMYGNQPRCVQEKYPDLRKYCYCQP